MLRRHLAAIVFAALWLPPHLTVAQVPPGQVPTLDEQRCQQYADTMENLCRNWCASGCVADSDPCMPFEWDREARMTQCRRFVDTARETARWQQLLEGRVASCTQRDRPGPARACAGPSALGAGLGAIAATPLGATSAILRCAELQSTHERLVNEAAALRAQIAALRNLSALDVVRTSLAPVAQRLEASAASASAALATAAMNHPQVSTNLSRRMGSVSDSMRSIRRALSSPNPLAARVDALEVERTAVAQSISGVRDRADAGGCKLTTPPVPADRPASVAVIGTTGTKPSIQQDANGDMRLITANDSAVVLAFGLNAMAFATGDLAGISALNPDAIIIRGGALSIASTAGATRSPPTVTTAEARITPRRTAYTVDRDPASNVTLIYVSEGSVEVQALGTGQRLTLSAGQWAAVTPGNVQTSATLPATAGAQPTVTAAAAAATPTTTGLLPDIDINGPMIRNFGMDQPRPELCMQACQSNPACVAYTYVKPGAYQPRDPPVCYLKSRVDSTYANNRVISGIVRGALPVPQQAVLPPAVQPPPPPGLAPPPIATGTPSNMANCTKGALVSRGKPASMSSKGGYADNPQGGVDGIINGGFGFHTAQEMAPWWDVDLGAPMPLHSVEIYNSSYSAPHRARTLRVLVSADRANWRTIYTHDGSTFGGIADLAPANPLVVPLRGEASRYVRLQLAEMSYLHLDEVEVFGCGAGTTHPPVIAPPGPPVQPAPESIDVLGQTWNESEVASWRGVWTRIGTSNEFDARFTHPSGSSIGGKLRMDVDRRNLRIFRWNPGTWGICSYIGTFSADFSSVAGTYQCTDAREIWSAPYAWSATIASTRVDANPPGHLPPPAVDLSALAGDWTGYFTARPGERYPERITMEYGRLVLYAAQRPNDSSSMTRSAATIESGGAIVAFGGIRGAISADRNRIDWSNGAVWVRGGMPVTPPPSTQGAPAGYTLCAQENQRCNFSGQRDVAYGANGKFIFKPGLQNGVDCNNGVFGDPIFGTVKACYIK